MNEPATAKPTANPAVPAPIAFQMLPLSSLMESPHNNRRHFDAKKLEELTASVRQKGVLTPLLARPAANEKFEIAAGHRRFRAATAAGNVVEVPVLVREMSDGEFLEVITIENLQREDIHEMDEANGYAELIEKHGYSVETIAAKVSKSASYVYQRLKLSALIPAAQKLFLEGIITAGHAILIARLSPEEQKEVLNKDTGILWPYDGMDSDHPFPVSVRGLGDAIRDELYLDLGKAPFKKDDVTLVPAAGACAVCPKRSGSTADGLFADLKDKNICTDRVCYNAKLAAMIARQTDGGKIVTVSSEYGRGKRTDGALSNGSYRQIYRKEDRCKYAQPAIMVDGNDRGQRVEICKTKDCTKHHRVGFSSPSRSETPAAKEKRLAKDAAEKAGREFETKFRRRLYDGIVADLRKSPKIQTEHLVLLAVAMRSNDWNYYGQGQELPDPVKEFGLKAGHHKPEEMFAEIAKLKPARLNELVIELALVPLLDVPHWKKAESSEILERFAKLHSLDVKAIEKQVRLELKPVDKGPVQTSAKPKGKVKKSGKAAA